MSIFKRGNVYWYHFLFQWRTRPEEHKARKSADSQMIEAAHRTALAKGEVGITERKTVPTLKAFALDFISGIEGSEC